MEPTGIAAAELAAAGLILGAHELQIAATAIEAGSEVATLNVDKFGRVPGLQLAKLAAYVRS
jgi:predicted nucleic acid-binding protein